jgi:hypothetical protein
MFKRDLTTQIRSLIPQMYQPISEQHILSERRGALPLPCLTTGTIMAISGLPAFRVSKNSRVLLRGESADLGALKAKSSLGKIIFDVGCALARACEPFGE